MISVIIPVYNSEQYLAKCLDTVLAQTYTDLQVVLVDNGSTDGSKDICQQYAGKDSRCKLVHCPEKGVSNARNAGLENADGQYAAFVDSDDWVAADYLEKLYDAMSQSNADLVICAYDIVEGQSVKQPEAVENAGQCFSFAEHPEHFKELYCRYYLNALWNKLYRRDKIQAHFESQISVGEDLLFNLAYLQQTAQVMVIPDSLYHYRQDSSQSLSHKYQDDRLEQLCYINGKAYEYYAAIGGQQPVQMDELFVQEAAGLYWDTLGETALSAERKMAIVTKLMKNRYFRKVLERYEPKRDLRRFCRIMKYRLKPLVSLQIGLRNRKKQSQQ